MLSDAQRTVDGYPECAGINLMIALRSPLVMKASAQGLIRPARLMILFFGDENTSPEKRRA